MTAPSDKSRPWWRRAFAWLGVKLAENLLTNVVSIVTVGVGAALLIGWVTGIGRFLVSKRTISAWQIGVLDAAALGFAVTTVALFLYTRKLRRELVAQKGTRASFQSIQVDDERLQLRWFVRQCPDIWLAYQDVQHRLSPQAVQDIIDGPYHAVCLERVQEQRAGYSGNYTSPVLMETCPGCGAQLFTTPYRNLERTFAFSWTVRAQALQELQRMHRSGMRIEGPRLVLERPMYWGDMTPTAD